MKYDIYELYPSARHAYIAIGLAVKTSRPHKGMAKLIKFLRSSKFINLQLVHTRISDYF